MRAQIANSLALLLVAVLCGCGTSKNYRTARYVEADGRYLVTMSGRRMLMAHDLISALLRLTEKTTNTFVLPRITGRIEGSEIPNKRGYYRYEGHIDILGRNMVVRLFFDNIDYYKKEEVSWNGKYILVKQ